MQEVQITKNKHTQIIMEEENIDVMDDDEPHAVRCALLSNSSALLAKQQPLNFNSHDQPITGQDRSLFYERSISEGSENCISVTAVSLCNLSTPSREESDESGFDSPHCSPLGTDTVLDSCSSEGSVVSDETTNTNIYTENNNNKDEKMYHNMTESNFRQYQGENSDILLGKHLCDEMSFLRGVDNRDRKESMDTSPEFMDRDKITMSSENYKSEINGVGPSLLSPMNFTQIPMSDHGLIQSKKSMPIATNEIHQCRWLQCSRKFPHLDDLVNHVNDAHIRAERDVDYKCYWDNCPRRGKGFNARYKMLIHVRTHTNEKPYKCDLCHKSFSRLENLKIHNRSHTGERPYMCPFEGCKKAYSNSSDRFKHVRTHQEQKPYCCRMPGCDKRYTDPSSLRKHIKTHGHYFRRLPSSPRSKQKNTTVKDDMKPPVIITHLSAPRPATAMNISDKSKDSFNKLDVSKSTEVIPCDSVKIPATGSVLPPTSVSYQSSHPHYQPPLNPIPLPTYLPPHPIPLSPQTPLAVYPAGEEYHHHPHPHHHHYHLSPLSNSGREDSISLKQLHETSLLSHLQLSYRSLLAGSTPGLSFPVGNTLLAVSPDGLPNTVPTQLIEIRGNMLHISNLAAEQLLAHQTIASGRYADTQSASTQTEIDISPPSPYCSLSSTRAPSLSPLYNARHDAPLDLSNPSSPNKSPIYVDSHTHKNEYHPTFTRV